ncbi:MAG: CARDB domain-containing protein [Tissierellia bacterium]|nr:CARDB domain-containing protein [Tissierellia bacterium]
MKKHIVAILVGLLLFSTLLPIHSVIKAEDDIMNQPAYIRIDGDKTVIGKPGDSFSIHMDCFVTGARPGDIVSATADASDNMNLYLLNGSDQMKLTNRTFDFMTGEDRAYLSFQGKIAPDAKSGTYAVNISISLNGEEKQKYTAYVRVEADEFSAADLTMSEIRLIPGGPEVEPGKVIIAGIEIENQGQNPAYNVTLKLEGLTQEGFTLRNGFDTHNFPSIQPGEKKRISFELSSLPSIKPGNYEFTLTMDHKGKSATEKEEPKQRKFFLVVGGNPEKASALVITNLKYPTKTLYPGNMATLSFDLTNKGQSEAKRVIVKSEVEGNGLVNRSISQHFIESLAAGETRHFEFSYYATPASQTQNYPVHIKVEYNDAYSSETPQTTEQIAGFFVSNPEKDNELDGKKKATPKLIIDRYEFEPKLPAAGEEFKMKLSFFNTNSKKTVKNIKIYLTSMDVTKSDSNSAGSNIFTPVDSSNTFYIDTIPPKGSVEKEITLYTVPDAIAKTYTVTANFEYEDNENNEYKATEEIGIPVVQASKLEIGEMQIMPPQTYVGEGVSVAVDFYNTGKVTLYNMMVKFESEELDAQQATYYIGNFVEGSTESYEVYVTANEPGTKKGKIIFSYEDSSGKKQEVEKEISIEVADAPEIDPNFDPNMGMDGMPGMDEDPSFFGKVKSLLKKVFSHWYIWIPLLLVVAAIIIVIVRKILSKKREKELTIDE